jgi:hypothetical protein
MGVAEELYSVVSRMMQNITEEDQIEAVVCIIQVRSSYFPHGKVCSWSQRDVTQFEVGGIKDFREIHAHRPCVSSNIQPGTSLETFGVGSQIRKKAFITMKSVCRVIETGFSLSLKCFKSNAILF